MADVLIATDEPVMTLRLDRPDKKNAITVAMYAALAEALERAAANDAIRVVAILGSGDMFTAGNDLHDFMAQPPVGTDQPVYRFLQAIAAFPKILIAGVQGRAVGIGTTMLLHCDFVVAAEDAVFTMPFIDLGLVPEAASSLLFPRMVGPRIAAKHLILGAPFDAEEALRYGVASEIAAAAALEARVAALAGEVAAKPAEAVRIAKAFIRDTGGTIMDRIEAEGRAFGERLQSAEARAAFLSFFAKKSAA
ncbi:enoyl-CoA hydratase/isomerase family protein [Allosphingosinicella flava]|uniref:Enoyl-CoA hydratase/isomerase family protein n=1 Tax=Allosphingosinicella flava TaxID=2771430 RepID=A0A7T2GHL0_9SPHN|nr:enoyl-CoA hydratase-related protein [Sphingosinicella flava]QPQ54031.1 enoyl-CoA hydratase/isomerase family protein [Sphingosinicella flava]